VSDTADSESALESITEAEVMTSDNEFTMFFAISAVVCLIGYFCSVQFRCIYNVI